MDDKPKLAIDDLAEAILWLGECDASPSMAAACHRVAVGLLEMLLKREREAVIRAISRETAVDISAVRARLAASGGRHHSPELKPATS